MKREGAFVELIDEAAEAGAPMLEPTAVRVNGVDVGWIAEHGVKVEQGSPTEPTRVTIVLLPSRVEIKAEPATQRCECPVGVLDAADGRLCRRCRSLVMSKP